MAIRKSIIHYEVIYDDEDDSLDCVSLQDIHHMTSDGGASGRFLDSDETILTNEEAFTALQEQGSDPEFLGLYRCGACDGVFREEEGFDIHANLCSECGF